MFSPTEIDIVSREGYHAGRIYFAYDLDAHVTGIDAHKHIAKVRPNPAISAFAILMAT